jgi:virginiamycin B lyase
METIMLEQSEEFFESVCLHKDFPPALECGDRDSCFAKMRAIMIRKAMRQAATASLGAFGILAALFAAQASDPKLPRKTGVHTPGVQHEMAGLVPAATFAVKGRPDWMAVTEDALWVTSASVNHVVRLDAKTNQPGTIVTVDQPCAGLAVGFGSLWIPSCGGHTVVRVDAETGVPQATIAAGPADSEGGIAVGAGSVWIVTSKDSDLARIDPGTNAVTAHIRLPAGSFNPVFANGSIWVSSNTGGTLVRVDPAHDKVVNETPVGVMPRFLTVGAGSIWVLNQGDGTIARVDASTGLRTALIAAGIPGEGGEIAFGEGAVWATVMDFPITRIDPATNTVTGQWHGAGGDSIRVAHGSVWLTNLTGAQVWRLPVPAR